MKFKYIAIIGILLIVSIVVIGSASQEEETIHLSMQYSGFYTNVREVEPDSNDEEAPVPHVDDDALEVPAPIVNKSEIIISRSGYTVSFNKITCCPNYVAWHLTSKRANGDVPRYKQFIADESIPLECRAYPEDYRGSGYDRGHMCPAGDNKDNSQRMIESFLLSNICPQNQSLNSGDWNEIEQTCRRWVKEIGDLYIVCGPIFDEFPYNTIGQNVRIAIPDRFFKVILAMKPSPRSIGFICPNQETKRPLYEYCVAIDKVEEITDIDFFPNLEDCIEDSIESECNPEAWNLVRAYR